MLDADDEDGRAALESARVDPTELRRAVLGPARPPGVAERPDSDASPRRGLFRRRRPRP